MAYVKPQVLVFQEFTIVPAEITEPLRAHISGPNAMLHRYNVADEKALIRLGAYDKNNETCYTWPHRTPGGVVDYGYVKLFADDALLHYYEQLIGDTETVTKAVLTRPNWIESVAGVGEGRHAVYYKSNGTQYQRSAAFHDRDVKIGDVVYLRAVDEDCVETTLWTEVTGFASDMIAATIDNAFPDVHNSGVVRVTNTTAAADAEQPVIVVKSAADVEVGDSVIGIGKVLVDDEQVDPVVSVIDDREITLNGPLVEDVAAGTSVSFFRAIAVDTDWEKVGGAVNNVTIQSVNASNYSGVKDGVLTEIYTVEVIANPTPGCTNVQLRIRSNSKLDDVAAISPGDFGDDVEIGTRGLTVKFTNASSSDTFVVGQKWSVTVTQAYTPVQVISNNDNSSNAGEYGGDTNDTYIVECVVGGDVDGVANYPQVVVRTARGRDHMGPFVVSAAGTTASNFFAVGSNGVAVAFAAAVGETSTGLKLRKGDKWYVTVNAKKAGAANKLILRHDLPAAMRGSDETPVPLDIRLYIKDDIQISQNRLDAPPVRNYTMEETQICVNDNVTAYHPEWRQNGVELPLPVAAGTLYVEYREWLSDLADEVNGIASVGEIDAIPGQLDPDNPLKWGVYKALSNSGGTVVKYTAVTDPRNLDKWQDVVQRLVGRDDLYNVVPMTFDKRVHDLFSAYILDESNEVANNWKGGFFAIPSRSRKMLVGEGAEIGDVAGNLITQPVLATASDNPEATGTQYTLLQTTQNGYFITNNVQPGDIVRYNFAVDGFGDTTYVEYVVDRVLSENALVLYSGPAAAVTVPEKVEIWHNMARSEMATDIARRAGVLSSRRVCAVWPDQVGSAGTLQPGFFLAAALAGLASGVVPHQGLTNVEVLGFDDYSRSYKLFNETQLNEMAEAGVWIVTQDRDGTPYTRHAVTTDNLDLNRREEMIRRNVDSISYLFLRRLRPYIGRTNATPGMVNMLSNRVTEIIDFLKSNGYTQELGSQLIDGRIRVLRIHPLLKDRIEIVLDLTVPAPLNNIELHLVV